MSRIVSPNNWRALCRSITAESLFEVGDESREQARVRCNPIVVGRSKQTLRRPMLARGSGLGTRIPRPPTPDPRPPTPDPRPLTPIYGFAFWKQCRLTESLLLATLM